ncbi:MAG TPA: DUF2950 domain-containing protein [Rhodanobacteraceae bacterium]|nr:DUF2950 domain-containing protein [Rhodanobacteraceae bacterium]
MKQNSITRYPMLLGAALALAFSTLAVAQTAMYPSADAAATALVDAVQKPDDAALAKVLGPGWRSYVPTDNVDRDDVDAFLASYKESHKIVTDGGTAHLEVGKAGWTLPMPIVQKGSQWTFDLKGAHDEIIARNIGRNELDTQQSILAFYDAERDYAQQDHNGDGVLEYAQKFISTPGKQDGLYWESKDGGPDSPLGPRFADGAVPKGGGEGYHGYHYRILTAQGPSAPGGAYTYIVGGRMRNGFAAIAWPMRYGETGVMTFMVSHDGVVFEKDLGKNGGVVAGAMKTFDPDSSWTEDKELEQ